MTDSHDLRLSVYTGLFWNVVTLLLLGIFAGPGLANDTVIDTFSRHKAAINQQPWRVYSDRVLGGRSIGEIHYVKDGNRQALHLSGEVKPGKNGGFIQARLSLRESHSYLNASSYEGIRLEVKGDGQDYVLMIRTPDCRRTREFYGFRFKTTDTWQVLQLPFTFFQAQDVRVPFDVTKLSSVALAGMGKRYTVDLWVDQIGFYGKKRMWKELTSAEKRVIVDKGTERPFTGEYNDHFEAGTYTCRRCSTPLYTSSSKFKSNCGWPSFDDEIPGAVKRLPDADGRRTEILCANCNGHLGHVFLGEGYTPKNTRHCVNSISMDFVPAQDSQEKAYFAGGCFWGVEHLFQQAPGVLEVKSGYMGGHIKNPSYKQVCTKKTGHVEVVEVVFNPTKTSYEKMARLFFEIHDFTQENGQGPDIGPQYLSVIFYGDDEQRAVAEKLMGILKDKGYDVATKLSSLKTFWPAEAYHQDYYTKTGKTPYCHAYKKVFDD